MKWIRRRLAQMEKQVGAADGNPAEAAFVLLQMDASVGSFGDGDLSGEIIRGGHLDGVAMEDLVSCYADLPDPPTISQRLEALAAGRRPIVRPVERT